MWRSRKSQVALFLKLSVSVLTIVAAHCGSAFVLLIPQLVDMWPNVRQANRHTTENYGRVDL
jgi:hypothetical protein